ncbi:uncharacterized protein LOC108863676 [Galendromus occidentalis]|uniref:Uncharacterized protein LOC108863676 n=1 Tax=Galendromus occidentalis TaxID=34638 RepID=A0AAJ7P8X0_9ACAR|nr:uncharacterized protein LOC108863676 [Galendromus occidentalis]
MWLNLATAATAFGSAMHDIVKYSYEMQKQESQKRANRRQRGESSRSVKFRNEVRLYEYYDSDDTEEVPFESTCDLNVNESRPRLGGRGRHRQKKWWHVEIPDEDDWEQREQPESQECREEGPADGVAQVLEVPELPVINDDDEDTEMDPERPVLEVQEPNQRDIERRERIENEQQEARDERTRVEQQRCVDCLGFTHRRGDPACPARTNECYYCHEFGHFARCCAAKIDSVKCYRCGKWGHFQRDCVQHHVMLRSSK